LAPEILQLVHDLRGELTRRSDHESRRLPASVEALDERDAEGERLADRSAP
jgi:hypothetical protein